MPICRPRSMIVVIFSTYGIASAIMQSPSKGAVPRSRSGWEISRIALHLFERKGFDRHHGSDRRGRWLSRRTLFRPFPPKSDLRGRRDRDLRTSRSCAPRRR